MIKTIIFDFWNVLTIKDGWPSIAKKLSSISNLSESEIKNKLYQKETKYILGQESTKEFWRKITPDISFSDFNHIMGSTQKYNEKLLDLISKLNKKYQISILSDNFEAVTSVLKKDKKFTKLFSKMYFSNDLALTKRNRGTEIHKFALKDSNLKAQKTLFIDDNPENLFAPKSLNMKVIHYSNLNQLKDDLVSCSIQF